MGPGRSPGGLALTVRIERIAAGGDGVGHLPDGRVVFVPRTAPGDLVEVTGQRNLRRHARARLKELVEAGPGRCEPRCPHYTADDCGGCQFQHLDLRAQLAAKRTIVQDALTRLARLEVVVPEVGPPANPWGYRSRVTLAVGPGRRHAGFHPLDQPGRVFPLRECAIARPELMRLWSALAPQLHRLPRTVERLTLRLDRDGGVHVLLSDEGTRAWEQGRELSRLLAEENPGVSVWWQPAGGAARVVGGSGEAFPATVFEQVNPVMGDRVRAAAVASLGELSGRHAWDLYAGIGEASAMLLAGGASVESVERDRRAVALAERQEGRPVGGNRRPSVRRYTGRVEELLPRLQAPDLIIANPPRTGLDPRAVEGLLDRPAMRMAYVSCDPATLGRDLARLSRHYRLLEVMAFDLFPQTAHVESVAVLEGR